MNKKDINNAQHPSRQLAIHILEDITEKLGKEIIGTTWYDMEDMVTNLIEEVRAKDREKITHKNKQIKALKERITYWEQYNT